MLIFNLLKDTHMKTNLLLIFIKRSLRVALICCSVMIFAAGCNKDDSDVSEDITVIMTDAVFRAHCLANFDTNMDGKLSAKEAAEVTQIDVSEMNIVSLKGIEYFTWLKTLLCEFNSIQTLDVSKNTRLEYLNCSYNHLQTLDVSKFTKLFYLNCYNNQLQILDVSKNRELTYFFCSYNHLQTLDVSKNTKLISLSCLFNQLQSLDVNFNKLLTYLYCSYNQLQTLDISNNTLLSELIAQNNLFSEIIVWKDFSSAELEMFEVDPGVTFKEKE